MIKLAGACKFDRRFAKRGSTDKTECDSLDAEFMTLVIIQPHLWRQRAS